MSNQVKSANMEPAPPVFHWRSIALPVAVVLISVEIQRHWGANSGWIYLCAGLLLDITWVGTLMGYAWASRFSGAVIDVALFFLLLCGVLLSRKAGNKAGPEILKSILFWAPAICGWWALSYHTQFRRILLYTALLYVGLYFLDYPDSDRHYYEYALIGIFIIGLGRLIAGGTVRFKLELNKLRSQTGDALMRDPLTGVASKTYFEAELSHMSAIANRYRFPYSLAICSVDGFDIYKDRHGDDAADDLLKKVSWRIAERLRFSDTLCHLGRGEFAILYPNTTEPNATKAVESIRLSIGAIPNRGEGAIALHVAICEHQFGEDSMATFDAAYRRFESARQNTHTDKTALPQQSVKH